MKNPIDLANKIAGIASAQEEKRGKKPKRAAKKPPIDPNAPADEVDDDDIAGTASGDPQAKRVITAVKQHASKRPY